MNKKLDSVGLARVWERMKTYVANQQAKLDFTLFKVVTALPTSDIDSTKIYLVPSTTTGDENIYTEYLYTGSAWEKLGEYKADVDLSDYAKTADVESKISAAQTTLQGNIESEATARDKAIAAAVAEETSARETADTTLSKAITAEETARKTAVTGEATARAVADTTLQTNIDNEATARKAADTTLQKNIDAEAKTRKEVDDEILTLVNLIVAALGLYDEGDPITITAEQSGKYVDTTGTVKTNSAYAISAPISLEKGHIYLVKPSADLIKGVALAAEYTTSERDVIIEYTYTYDSDGTTKLTATADYDSSLVYTYNYETDTEGNKTLKNITDKSGNIVDYLPQYRTVSAGSYVPLFKALSSDKPISGYFTVAALEDCKVAFSLPTGSFATPVRDCFIGLIASLINNKEDKTVVKKLQEQVQQLVNENSMFAQANFKGVTYDTAMESDPVADGEYGSDNPSDLFDFLLVDHTATPSSNGGQPYSVLTRNNIFRYKDGTYAKTVSITEDEMAACTDTTYSRSIYIGSTIIKTFAEGEDYDAEAVLDAIKSAISAGTVTLTSAITLSTNGTTGGHVVMPWETTSQDMSIFLGNTKSVWLIDHQEGKSGKYHTALLRRNTVIDGIDPTDFELKPTGLSPSPVFTITDSNSKVVTRCHFTTRIGMTNCQGAMGNSNFCSAFYQNGTYPRTVDIQQITLMKYARNNNSDVESPIPFAEGGFHTLNTLLCALEIEHKTKYLHNPNLFSGGICANDDCSTEAKLKAYGGVRYKASDSDTWTYIRWYTNPEIYKADGTKIAHVSSILNQEAPKERTMESQMAMSWAAELGIAPSTEFTTPYGGTYQYENVDGTTSAPSSLMAARVCKTMAFDITAYNASAEETTFNIECVLRMGLYNGANLSGDIFRYCGGGAELIALVTEDAQLKQGVKGLIPETFYLQPDQSKWPYETNSNKDNLEKFDCQSSFLNLGTSMNADGYIKDRLGYSPFATENGGSLSTYMCSYIWNTNYFNTSTLNRRTRVAFRVSALAYLSHCSPRYLRAYNSCAYTSRDFGGLAQVLLGEAVQPQ